MINLRKLSSSFAYLSNAKVSCLFSHFGYVVKLLLDYPDLRIDLNAKAQEKHLNFSSLSRGEVSTQTPL